MKKILCSARFEWFLVTFLFLTGDALAQEAADRFQSPPVIRVSSEAVISARPDRAEIDVGVVTESETAQAAAAQNAERINAVLKELRKLLGPKADIQTTTYTVNPIYASSNVKKPEIKGYSVTNVIRVKTEDLTRLGKILDVATASGANKIFRLDFTLEDDRTILKQALQQAAVQAREDAETIAGALGLKIVRVLSVEENGSPVRPFKSKQPSFRGVSGAAEIPTSIESGTVEVRVAVSLTVEIGE